MFLSTKKAGLFLLAAVVFSACNKKKDAPPPPAPTQVTLQKVRFNTATYFDEYPGTLMALDQVELRPQATGFISGVYFKDGDRVRKGQLLYSIDNQLYAGNYEQAVANQQVQQANVNRAQKDAKRYHILDEQDAVAKQLVDNADAALEVSRKQLAAATANIKAVQTSLNYTKVYAPFDGVIGISNVKKGTAVSAGQTVLNTVSTVDQMAVDFNVDQKEIYRFTEFLNKDMLARDSTFTLAFGDVVFPFPGKLSLLDRTVNPQTGTIKARLVFPNTNGRLISGMNATVRVKAQSSQYAVLIPNKAVTEQLGEFFVYVAGDSNKVSQRQVELGKPIGADIIISKGLEEGETVVVEGVQNLKEGSEITTKPPAKKEEKK